MKNCVILIFVISNIVNTMELNPTYAKVARWGASDLEKNENTGRSGGSVPLTYRYNDSSRINIRNQNQRNKPTVTYYYSMPKTASKLDMANIEHIPAKGEVQERFNPRPYFDFTFDNSPRPNQQTVQDSNSGSKSKPPTIVYGTPVDTLPLADAYSSPFNSYNPSNEMSSDSKHNSPDNVDFPPNNNQPQSPPYWVQNENKTLLPSTSYGVPDNVANSPPSSFKLPTVVVNTPPKEVNDDFHPPLAPPSSLANSELHKDPDDDDLISPSHSDGKMPYYGPLITQTVKPPDSIDTSIQSPSIRPMSEDDLSPPPPPESVYVPQYLDHEPSAHDFYHFPHHPVYHEVHTTTTTTTTAAPRAGPYSYYYLGRKLWYVPLYFSLYFICYVTVLILKSIARHKIRFSHYFDRGRESRQLDVDAINKDVVVALNKTRNMYM